MNEIQTPLVSVMIPNYNHSRFLDQCIQSAINQTYKNLEIVILDNVSEDDSVAVASKYMADYRVSVCRNQFNVQNLSYRILDKLTHGKYKMMLCADDYIHAEFIQQSVDIMEKYPQVGYVHGERDFVDEDGNVLELDPFYRCSFVAPGRNAMPIYMLTPVAHPSQGIFRTSAFKKIHGYDKEIDHMNADKTLWFYLSYVSDMAYIREKMCGIRVGNQTETYITTHNFQHSILSHLTINDFVKFAREKNIPEVYEREEVALNKLAHEFISYAAEMLYMEDYVAAQQHLDYAKVLCRAIEEDTSYNIISDMVIKRDPHRNILFEFASSLGVGRKRSYDPPVGYIEL